MRSTDLHRKKAGMAYKEKTKMTTEPGKPCVQAYATAAAMQTRALVQR